MELIKIPEGKLQNYIARVKVDPEKDHMIPGAEVTIDISLLKNLIVWMEKENPDIGGVRISLWDLGADLRAPLVQTVHQYDSDRSEHYAIAPIYNGEDEPAPAEPSRRRELFPKVTRKELKVEKRLACIYVRQRQRKPQINTVNWLAHVEV